MTIREFKEQDQKEVEEIFSLYWTDPVFLRELSNELTAYLKQENNNPRFFIAKENDEIVGITGYKRLPDYLKGYAKTSNPVELYIIAAKYKRKGIGIKLKCELLKEIKKANFTEVLLYSPETHKDSWGFHDLLNFERAGKVTPPEDELGQVWRKIL